MYLSFVRKILWLQNKKGKKETLDCVWVCAKFCSCMQRSQLMVHKRLWNSSGERIIDATDWFCEKAIVIISHLLLKLHMLLKKSPRAREVVYLLLGDLGLKGVQFWLKEMNLWFPLLTCYTWVPVFGKPQNILIQTNQEWGGILKNSSHVIWTLSFKDMRTYKHKHILIGGHRWEIKRLPLGFARMSMYIKGRFSV